MIFYFLIELYDPKPDKYDDRIVPLPIDHVKTDYPKETITEKSASTDEQKEVHEVVGLDILINVGV